MLEKLVTHLNLEPYTGREQRLKTILGMIAKQLDDNGDTRFAKGVESFESTWEGHPRYETPSRSS